MYSLDIQVDISPPLTVKSTMFSTHWLQFSLITLSQRYCKAVLEILLSNIAEILETHQRIVRIMDMEEYLRSLVGRALRARSKSLCVASVWPCFRRKEAYFSHTDFS